MEITLNNTSAEEAKKAMAKNVAELEKKYVGQFGQEFMNNYKEGTSKIAGFLIDGVREVYEHLCKTKCGFTAVTVEFMDKTRAVVTGLKKEDGSHSFEVLSNDENIPTYCCDLFNAIFNYEAVDLVFGELKGTNSNIELGILKKDYNDIDKFYNELVKTAINNAGDNDQINIWNKEIA